MITYQASIRTFELHWSSGEVEIIKGTNIADAFAKAGYSQGALGALDYYTEI